jgi:transcriptional regulator with XRE-family HTH domain
MAKKPAPPRPVDDRIRRRLREARPNQSELARELGRGAAWVNKYMYGTGHATIDDIIGMAAYFGVSLTAFIGDVPLPKPAKDSKLLRAWVDSTPEGQKGALAVLHAFRRSRTTKKTA